VVDLRQSPSLENSINPSHSPPTPPERPSQGNFTRFLGPDSIEDLFKPQSEHPGDVSSADISSMAYPFPERFDSLDQYVSTLDLQTGQDHYNDINDNANWGDLASYTNPGNVDTTNGDAQPFIPLSPYLMQTYSPGGTHLLPSEPFTFLPNDYYGIGQNNTVKEAPQEIMDDLWTIPEKRP
jgi:hypothetical protein